MTNHELQLAQDFGDGVYATPVKIDFPGYELMIARATEVADYINNIELTEDNMKDVKQTLADARKLTNHLDTKRKNMKNALMTDFTAFEGKIKEIIGIIDDADSLLRSKVRDVEESQREARYESLRTIWNKRAQGYSFQNVLGDCFDRWVTPKHLNKTTTVKSAEADMTSWMEQRETDVAILVPMGADYVAEYVNILNLAQTIQIVNERKKAEADIQKVVEEETEEKVAIFKITGEKDITLTEAILKQNKINFERV